MKYLPENIGPCTMGGAIGSRKGAASFLPASARTTGEERSKSTADNFPALSVESMELKLVGGTRKAEHTATRAQTHLPMAQLDHARKTMDNEHSP